MGKKGEVYIDYQHLRKSKVSVSIDFLQISIDTDPFGNLKKTSYEKCGLSLFDQFGSNI